MMTGYVQVMARAHDAVGIFKSHHAYFPQWQWRLHGPEIGRVYRYRIRRPDVLRQLIDLVEARPDTAPAEKADA